MQKTIIDSGPLIALFDASDKYHKVVLNFMKEYKGKLISFCVLSGPPSRITMTLPPSSSVPDKRSASGDDESIASIMAR